MLEGAIEVGRENAADEIQRSYVENLQKWVNTEMWPGIEINFEELFPTTEEQRFWSQTFHTLAQRVYHRRWGNQVDQTWQVHFIAACHLLSLMLCSLVWRAGDRTWFPQPTDVDGIRPDPMRFQL
jgi:hypothetical protein